MITKDTDSLWSSRVDKTKTITCRDGDRHAPGVQVPVGSSGEKLYLFLSGVIILTLGLDDLLLFLLSCKPSSQKNFHNPDQTLNVYKAD